MDIHHPDNTHEITDMGVASSPPINIPYNNENSHNTRYNTRMKECGSSSAIKNALACWTPGDPVENEMFPILETSLLTANEIYGKKAYYQFNISNLKIMFYPPVTRKSKKDNSNDKYRQLSDPALEHFPETTTLVSDKEAISYEEALNWISNILNKYQRDYPNPWLEVNQRTPCWKQIEFCKSSAYYYCLIT